MKLTKSKLQQIIKEELEGDGPGSLGYEKRITRYVDKAPDWIKRGEFPPFDGEKAAKLWAVYYEAGIMGGGYDTESDATKQMFRHITQPEKHGSVEDRWEDKRWGGKKPEERLEPFPSKD